MQEIRCPKCGEVFQVDESGYAAIVKQVRDREFEKQLHETHERFLAEKEAALQVEKAQALSELERQKSASKQEILSLMTKLQNAEKDKELAVEKALSEGQKQLFEEKEALLKLENEAKAQEKEYLLREQALKTQYEERLKAKNEELEFYKDLKARQSTKMLGETLEQHCEISFNQLRATGFQTAVFEKDNDARTGSKGDYIFKDYEDGIEYISIMFEMKNEADTTATKHKNEDFFKELDKDRREKNCEYAVLVSMLESDSELYNGGIVDVSHRYEKMYVIRPQFFIPMITLLRNAAKGALEYKKALAVARSQHVDVENFEAAMNDFKAKFGRNYKLASDKFQAAIEEIDKSISHLTKTKEALLGSINNLRLANDKAEELSIKRLTKNSPSLREAFEGKAGRD